MLSSRMVHLIEALASDWRQLEERIEALSSEIAALASGDAGCERLMSIREIAPIISSAMVAAVGTGDGLLQKTSPQGLDWSLGKPRPETAPSSASIEARKSLLARPVWCRQHGSCLEGEADQMEGHELKRWIEAAKKRLHRNVLAIAQMPTSSRASPRVFLLGVEH